MTPLSKRGEQISGEVFSSASQNAKLRLQNKHFHERPVAAFEAHYLLWTYIFNGPLKTQAAAFSL